MTDFNKILSKAKELEAKMKESQEKIKKIRAEGVAGSNSIKVILDGEGEMQKIEISNELLKEEKSIVEDLIVAAHNNAKAQLNLKNVGVLIFYRWQTKITNFYFAYKRHCTGGCYGSLAGLTQQPCMSQVNQFDH